jgi:uroporphyrin-3 C-methyltransferase
METPQTEITPETSGWRAALRRPAVRVGLVALVIIVAQWVDTRMQVASLQQELARRLADSESMAREGRRPDTAMQESLAAQLAKVSVLEARLAETQSQAVALEAMYQELSSSRDERLLAEVEQAVVIAMQQLQFSGNVEAALIALQGAEGALRVRLQPQFLPVRKLIARDIERLKGIPGANISGLSLKIESVVAAVDGLPLAYEQRPKPVAPKAGRRRQAGQRGLLAGAGRRAVARVPPTGAHRAHRSWRSGPAGAAAELFPARKPQAAAAQRAPCAAAARRPCLSRGNPPGARAARSLFRRPRQAGAGRAIDTGHLAATDVSFDLPGLAETLTVLRNLKLARERRGATAK